jgi:hypothetical protein
VVDSPESVWALIILLSLGAVLSGVSIFMSRRVLVSPGQVMDETRLARVEVTITDPAATEADRQLARENTARIFVADSAVINTLVDDVRSLPGVAAAGGSFGQVPADVVERFSLKPEGWAAARAEWAGGKASEAWNRRCDRLAELLRTHPIVEDAEVKTRPNRSDRLQLVVDGAPTVVIPPSELLSADDRLLESRIGSLALQAGFYGDVLAAVSSRLSYKPAPTFHFDVQATREARDKAAANTPQRVTRIAPGDVLYARGGTLTSQALDWAELEQRAYNAQSPPSQIASDAGAGVAMLIAALGVGAYLGTFASSITARPRRLAALCGLFAGAVIVSCASVLIDAKLMASALVVPSVFLASVLVVAYDRRTGLAVGSLLVVCTALALHQSLEEAVPGLAGVGLMVWQLRTLRTRGTLVRAGLVTGLLTAGVTLLLAAVRMPLADASSQMGTEALSVGIGVLMVGFVVLGLLPTIERTFRVVTALSLMELRDPSHPLLRRLQQRAPGTYSHSMNVATLAETAAQAIGGDGLLAYVGALYHDVGKMNRPEFFIENQTGVNRHDRLPPAMSTLMIVSHVPDGLQLAKEHNLPRPLHHFIEAHHGTTIVEYFFRRAVKQYDDTCAAGKSRDASCPTEGEYRYPGPKPRTKEVACVMICDASESTARTMADPSAVKIEQMVRAIADKRLADGQFDECELTMAELTTIVSTVSKSLASIYHQRVAYPEAPKTSVGVPVGKPVEPAKAPQPAPSSVYMP